MFCKERLWPNRSGKHTSWKLWNAPVRSPIVGAEIHYQVCTEKMLSTGCSQPIHEHSKSTHARHRTLMMDSFDPKLPIHLIKTFLELNCNLKFFLLICPLLLLLYKFQTALWSEASPYLFLLPCLYDSQALSSSPPKNYPEHLIPSWHLFLEFMNHHK